mmetsp:Transcript_9902/g.22381  ORF Transcript_9902/g.22381 Transcript_9902/m.22381 type:complete len:227 (-) Transcript_9902:1498-2178(-)
MHPPCSCPCPTPCRSPRRLVSGDSSEPRQLQRQIKQVAPPIKHTPPHSSATTTTRMATGTEPPRVSTERPTRRRARTSRCYACRGTRRRQDFGQARALSGTTGRSTSCSTFPPGRLRRRTWTASPFLACREERSGTPSTTTTRSPRSSSAGTTTSKSRSNACTRLTRRRTPSQPSGVTWKAAGGPSTATTSTCVTRRQTCRRTTASRASATTSTALSAGSCELTTC